MDITEIVDYPDLRHLLREDGAEGPNVPLLLAVSQYIHDHPETWVQNRWHCETGMCFAGHAASMTGGVWTEVPYKDRLVYVPEDGAVMGSVREYGTWPADRAQRVLGLTDEQGDQLFRYDNDMLAIDLVIADILDGWEEPRQGMAYKLIAHSDEDSEEYVREYNATQREVQARREAWIAAHPDIDYAAITAAAGRA